MAAATVLQLPLSNNGHRDKGNTLEEADSRDVALHGHSDNLPPVRGLLIVMLCMFQGYAAMNGPPQQKLKKALGIGQVGAEAHLFTQATVFVHWGKFVARLGHSIFLAPFSPMVRVYISMGFMLVGCMVPPLFVFALGSKWIGIVFISYGLSGIGLGVFECTFLNVITPFGKLSKSWAIMGAPLGFGIVCIFGLTCVSMGVPVEVLYWYIVACVPIGMVVFWKLAPRDQGGESRVRPQADMAASCVQWRSWLPGILPHIVAKVVVNFVMENVTPVNFYTYNAARVPFFNKMSTSNLMDVNRFFALLYVFVLVGDTVSRRVLYALPLNRYSQNVSLLFMACCCSILGFSLEFLATAAVTLPAVFLAFWGNGLVYAITAKYIDRFVPQEHNLVAYSMWCFMGDFGSILGGYMVDVVRNQICGGHEYPFECRKSN